jgi:hypothetical protein
VLSEKIENKLDEFFSDDDSPSETPAPSASLEKLKSTVLSIDWEITDECLGDLIAETDILLEAYHADRPTNALLRMLKALANYIRKHKAQAHQEAIKRVMSVYKSVESIVEEHAYDENRKKEIVTAEIKAFHLLKEQVRVQRSSAAPKPDANDTMAQAPMETVADSGNAKAAQGKDVATVLSDFESKINNQIEQLKSQLADIKTELANYIKK